MIPKVNGEEKKHTNKQVILSQSSQTNGHELTDTTIHYTTHINNNSFVFNYNDFYSLDL